MTASARRPGPHEPREPDEPPPLERCCDLVLTGGVTSGVLYPAAVCHLALHYRFHALGGTSVGALAVAITAAAEYQRRLGSDAGFDVLAQVPEKLAAPIAMPQGRVKDVCDGIEAQPTTLLSLFQPDTRAGARLLRLFLAANPTGVVKLGWGVRLRGLLRELPTTYPLVAGTTGLALLAAFGLSWAGWRTSGWPVGLLATFLPVLGALALGLVVLLLAIGRDLRRGALDNHLGLCTGRGQKDSGKGLIDWLHDSIQWASGRQSHETPLTFRDLWDAPETGLPPPADPTGPRRRSIDLRMVSTCLSHGRPVELPLADSDENATLFFALEEWQPYFPDPVIALLRSTCPVYEDIADRYGAPTRDGLPPGPRLTLLQMPRERMPLLVAARMSLSFPGIFSTVPAWSLDLEERCWRRLRYSDGGICANFPIHLFDAAVPRWPTFGILLSEPDSGLQPPPHATEFRSPLTGERGHVWLPRAHHEGAASLNQQLPEGGVLSAVIGYALQSLNTARRWQDYTLSRMPGVRERVARVTLAQGEGELDLRMRGADIERLGQTYGRCAADLLLDAYLSRADAQPSPAWSEHRWVRWNLLAEGLRARLAGLTQAAEDAPCSTPLSSQIDAATTTCPLRGGLGERPDPDAPGSTGRPEQRPPWSAHRREPRHGQGPGQPQPRTDLHPLDDDQRAALAALLDSLCAVEAQMGVVWREQPYQPEPRPVLTVRPSL
ncbi:patatin-like phospholipase domain-containing protein [Leptothrix discophora]|uniref:Patatin-like phospholipase family protein n=1 Tax=Leptothrix discophora TaxID=89 RepID=A0ABT9G3M6_LEPDI|nr:patatin-like phospholipase family protein [Leptothrix discophora]MDP4301073.1 patatin-like phospholipase family protein [Leptothrix discophora]